jgi:hypothetical protein
MEICERNTAAHNPAKDVWRAFFLPLIIRETAMVKLVAARIKVSIKILHD